MAKLKKIPTQFECYCCGGHDLVLHTTTKQNKRIMDEMCWAWMGREDDEVHCTECGFIHYLAPNKDGSLYLSWDEETPHNLFCWRRVYDKEE